MNETVAVVGLGYVGLPLALSLAEHLPVIGYDASREKVQAYMRGCVPGGEVEERRLLSSTMTLASHSDQIAGATVYIVAVPTPIDATRRPDLRALQAATKTVADVLKRGDLVVYESTVYPGVTEDICVPLLEKSGLKLGDFEVGYSPERINPGDREHDLATVTKIVSGSSDSALERLAELYGLVVHAPIHRAPSIRVAEAAKLLENVQRDVNIALVNELALIFARGGLDTHSVIEAAATKWNFAAYWPGLVGGHCIAVDPYYLTYYAETLGYHPEVMLAGRRVNDAMGRFVARAVVRGLCKVKKSVVGARVAVLGATFKENVPDVRNTRVKDIVDELAEHEVEVHVVDPIADQAKMLAEIGYSPTALEPLSDLDAVVVAVRHRPFRDLGLDVLRAKCGADALLFDVKRAFVREEAEQVGFRYWTL